MKIFDYVQGIKPKRNKFDLSYENKLTLNMGDLVPVFTHEVLPGDVWRVNSQCFLRTLALIAPVMHRVDVWFHYFFVPNRLIWDEWENFITGGPNGTSEPIPPYFDVGKDLTDETKYIGLGSLADYLGLPVLNEAISNPGVAQVQVSALPFRAYQLIYNEYYRDQNYIDPVIFDGWKASGNTYSTAHQKEFMTLRKRAWEHDYFTSVLPNSQKGALVEIPLGGDGSMTLSNIIVTDTGGTPVATSKSLATNDASTPEGLLGTSTTVGTDFTAAHLEADVSDVDISGVSVDSLRQSVSLQGFLEAMMRFGSRYVEYLRGIFGTNPKDSRLQRPEYLGGGTQQVVISEVLQTSQSGTTPQGNMAGHGISVGRTNGFNRSFDEHGFVIGIMSVIPRTQYNSNMDKMWFRANRLDYYQPHLAHLGERVVIQAELQLLNQDTASFDPFVTSGDSSANKNPLGYQSQYAEYKYISGQTHGQFNDTLAFWTLGRQFDSTAPTPINKAFIECTPREDIFAVEGDTDHLVCQIFHEVSALRPIPLFSTPSLLFPSHA